MQVILTIQLKLWAGEKKWCGFIYSGTCFL